VAPLTRGLDDPILFSNQPMAIQVVCRPFDDEELIDISLVIDKELHRESTELYERPLNSTI
jgi:Asp-tRNA(Asn)/Glu-tRNA(Gln) amidotransferase A subunit family amidase